MKYSITLLSDTLPGSGFEPSIHIDSDVVVDGHGIPMIPGKRVKGLLLESALEYAESFAGKPDHYEKLTDRIKRLFGRPGTGFARTIQVSNAQWNRAQNLMEWLEFLRENDTNKILAWLYQPTQVTDHFTYLRAQTALEDGVAKEHSLRVMRVLKKGQTFTGSLESRDGQFIKDDLDVLNAAARNLRFMGLGRNRGFGHIAFQLVQKDSEVRS